ncbi:DNA adenine methylase [bacterium]|nr:DNA adenine methylase [Clostridia bacterium]MBQ4078104.1 DNA adenine methylase [bacterium]
MSIIQENPLLEFYKSLESEFNVNYPSNERATYSSSMNFSNDLDTSFQRWFRYKEGFSIEMVKGLINKYNQNKNGIIMDPFMGSGSTLIAANQLGLEGCGFEVNPFSYFLASCKLENYTKKDVEIFNDLFNKLLKIDTSDFSYNLPELSFSDRVFSKEIEAYYMGLWSYIKQCKTNQKVSNLLKLGWLSILEKVSNYKKAGNGLKIKNYKKPQVLSLNNIQELLKIEYEQIYQDLLKKNCVSNNTIYNSSCLEIYKKITPNSICGCIFSPPYANCFDYTEIYKLELWFGEFIKNYSDLKQLKKSSLRSNLTSDLSNLDNFITIGEIEYLLKLINTNFLWDKKIPTMLQLYFSDMFNVIKQCYEALENNGFCCIVVGNSSYGNIVFPTDLLLAKFAKNVGFEVDEINVGRYIITSSQQYKKTISYKNYLRESIICLKKI